MKEGARQKLASALSAGVLLLPNAETVALPQESSTQSTGAITTQATERPSTSEKRLFKMPPDRTPSGLWSSMYRETPRTVETRLVGGQTPEMICALGAKIPADAEGPAGVIVKAPKESIDSGRQVVVFVTKPHGEFSAKGWMLPTGQKFPDNPYNGSQRASRMELPDKPGCVAIGVGEVTGSYEAVKIVPTTITQIPDLYHLSNGDRQYKKIPVLPPVK